MNALFHRRAVDGNPKQALFSWAQFLFWMAMSSTSFMVVVLQENGYTGTQIGLMMSLISAMGIFSQTMWGVVSDKIGSLRKTLMLLMLLGCVAFGLTGLVGHVQVFPGFILALILLPLCTFTYSPQSALLDTWIIDTANHEGGISYSRIRTWGSLGYAIVTFAVTWVADQTSARMTMLAYPVFALMLILLCSRIGEAEHRAKPARVRFRDMPFGKLFKNYYYMTYLPFIVLINTPFSLAGNYLSYLLQDVGASINGVGSLAGLRAIFEIPALMLCPLLFRRFNRATALVLCATLHLIAQIGYCFAPNMAVIYLFQAIGGLAGGLMIGTGVSYIYQVAPKDLIATAQTFSGALSSAGAIVFSALGGRLLDLLGVRPLFAIAACLLVFNILYFVTTHLIGRRVLHIPFPEDEHADAA